MKKLLVIIVCAIIYLPVLSQEVEISSEKVLINGEKFYLHTVKQGQTLYGIGKAYSVTVDDIIKANTEAADGIKAGQVLKIPLVETANNKADNKKDDNLKPVIPDGVITHKVEKKETVFSICKKYNLSVEALYKANPTIQEKGLKAGDILIIPESDLIDSTPPELQNQPIQEQVPVQVNNDSVAYSEHIILKGETLSSIAKKYDVTVDDIVRNNLGISADKIRAGDTLKIPRKPKSEAAFPPETNNIQNPVIDTVKKQEAKSIEYKIKNELNVVMLLPFEIYVNTKNWYNQELGSKDYTVLPVTEMMLSYYGGCLLAFDSIKQTGLKVNMNVIDTGSDTSSLGSLVNKEIFKNADLIIGPVYSKQINYIKDFIPETAVVLSPFTDYEKVDIGDKSVIWANPGKMGRSETIAAYAATNASNKYIIIYNNNDKSKVDAEELAEMISKTYAAAGKTDSLNVSLISATDANGSALNELLSTSRLNVIIADEKNEAQLSSIMARLVQIKDIDIQLIGEKSWLDYKSIDVNYYQKLKFGYITPYFIDYNNEKSLKFIYKYRQIFLTEPDEYSFAAYDQMLLFTSLYMRYGGNLSEALSGREFNSGMGSRNRFVNIHGSRQYVQSFCSLMAVDENFEIIRMYP